VLVITGKYRTYGDIFDFAIFDVKHKLYSNSDHLSEWLICEPTGRIYGQIRGFWPFLAMFSIIFHFPKEQFPKSIFELSTFSKPDYVFGIIQDGTGTTGRFGSTVPAMLGIDTHFGNLDRETGTNAGPLGSYLG
jgi:hypothetical protein